MDYIPHFNTFRIPMQLRELIVQKLATVIVAFHGKSLYEVKGKLQTSLWKPKSVCV